MAQWLNKWLLITGFPLFFYMGKDARTATADSTPAMHPFHLAVVEIEHNAADRSLEISCKIYTDDFETILKKINKTQVDLINPADKKQTQKWISDYVNTHLKLTIDGKACTLTGIGFERENDAIYSYFQVDGISSVKKIDITNKILFDMFDDQTNVMHVTVGGGRKSGKLEYPKTEASFSF
jgi:hypothetical protein